MADNKTNKDTLGDRIKSYEAASNYKLSPNSVVIIRVDGKAFHTYTKRFHKPFSNALIETMAVATEKTARSMQGFKLAYTQSDESTFMISDFDTHESKAWFNYEINKIVSITASTFTAYFNQEIKKHVSPNSSLAMFDARAFVVPRDDWQNVFVWRQRDWERNSVQMLGNSQYSHKELQGVSNKELKNKLRTEKMRDWDALKDSYKYGTFIDSSYNRICEKLNYNDIDLLVNTNNDLPKEYPSHKFSESKIQTYSNVYYFQYGQDIQVSHNLNSDEVVVSVFSEDGDRLPFALDVVGKDSLRVSLRRHFGGFGALDSQRALVMVSCVKNTDS